MTLQEAFDKHPDDVRWLRVEARTNFEDWSADMDVTHRTDGINDLYLGEDEETVFVVFGQSEPQLTCDAELWKMYHDDDTWESGDKA
jgi:hypothetical protein